MTEDYMTKSHGIRSGEPKRPESLIEMPSMVPEVPEVSLCLTQEKSQQLHSNKAFSYEVAGDMLDHHRPRHQPNESLQRNKHESYNTWKAKNAQALHDITGSQDRIEHGSKRASSTKRLAGLVRKQTIGKEMYFPPTATAQYSNNSTANEMPIHSNRSNNSSAEYTSQLKENVAQQQISASNMPCNGYPTEHQSTRYPVQKHSYPSQSARDSDKDSQQTEEIYRKPSSPSSIPRNHYSCRERVIGNIPYQVSEKSNLNSGQVFCVPNYCNKLQCPCERQKVPSLNGNQYVNELPLTEEPRINNKPFGDTAKLYTPLDAGLIMNHLNSYSHILNIQKEQISILCQEMNTQKMLMSKLLEEIKLIHAAVSPRIQLNKNLSPIEKTSCQNCSCEQKNQHSSKNESSEDALKIEMKNKCQLSNTQPSISPERTEKRSVGVMTSSIENTVNRTGLPNEKDKSQRTIENVAKSKNPHKSSKASNSPSPNKAKQTNKKERNQREENKKHQSDTTQKRKNKKEESNESNQSDNSFSLDENAVVVRTETELGSFSPDVSIHVDMPDYSGSSSESDTSNSSDSDEGQVSGSEDISGVSDPHIGWTFYDRVVGQVNNMLKKTAKDPRQEYVYNQRKNAGNVLYQCNGDYETENNWSKRVTFDGPPLEDSDTNGMQLPRYHQFRTNQDYRMPGGPDRMQDFVMCDYANGGNNLSLVNGSTNVSFATYRYYQRHQLLPPPPPHRVPDQVFLDPPKMKKKNKSRKNEKTPPMSQKNHRRRSGGPPSKLLDMSALRHQPKLF